MILMKTKLLLRKQFKFLPAREKSFMRTAFIFCLLSFVFYNLSSQVPVGFNYQAIAREGANPVTTPIDVRLTIQSTAVGGTTFWIEKHSGVQPNASGLFTIVIGNGVKQPGSTANVFTDIDWSSGLKYLKTEIDKGSGYITMGTSQFLTVPYSMVADGLGGSLDKLTVAAPSTSTSMTDPLFEVKNNTGQTIFAVYNEGVRIYVDNGSKGIKGGFAIGGFGTDKAASQPLFVVNSDSIRAYIDPVAPVKGVKGGFAIGGFGMAKGGDEYLRVTRDSTRIYINNLPSGKGIKGGFAIGGFGMNKGNSEYLRVTDDSVRVYIDETTGKGVKAGFAIGGFGTAKGVNPKYLSVSSKQTNVQGTDSLKGFSVSNINAGTVSDFMNINKVNYSIGHESGLKTTANVSLTKGKYNVFFGYKSGFNNTEGYGNIFLGHESGFKSTIGSYNVYMGYRSGNSNVNGNSNAFLGYQSGEKSTNSYNTYLGQGAGKENSIGTQNTYVGTQAGIDDGKFYISDGITPGSGNTFVGFRAGASSFGGSNNVYIGVRAGELNNGYRSGRVFIGYNAGYNDVNDNRLYIDNSSTTTPLIYGEFNTTMTSRQLTINGKMTTNGSFNYGVDAQTSDAYVVTIPGISAYVAGMVITFKANTINTGPCSVNVNNLGIKTLKVKVTADPINGYIASGTIVMAVYDGTNFQMIQPSAL
jgi:hypothetical protein